MKFGKHILSQQISGWGSYYLDYKSLKKIINSLEKGRLTDAALFASGIRPEHIHNGNTNDSIIASGGVPSSYSGAGTNAQILPRTEKSDELQAHKAAFFFKLERELEKINQFYLQKEAELKVRLHTLVDKKNLILARRGAANLSKDSPSFYALYEGFRYFEKDLSKLQQFIEVNATGFRKILKKWDKRSKSQTKELYLARQVEVQPCFNREFIAELSDLAAANLLDLENLSESKSKRNGSSLDTASATNGLLSEKRLDFAAARDEDVDLLSDLEKNLSAAIKSGNVEGARDMARMASQNEDGTSVSRVIWRALLDADQEALERAIAGSLPDYAFVDDINSRTCLHEACLAGNLLLVKSCIANKVDVSKRDIYGRTALSYAAITGHAQICTFLLALPNVNPATADLDGFSPLVLAVMNGHADVVEILLAHSVSVEPTAESDLIPLCLASEGGHAKITSMLLARGAKILPNTEGLTPQALAARVGHADCLRLLVEAGADANVREKGTLWTPLFFAAENGHLDCIRILITAGAHVDAQDEKHRNPAFYAAWKGQIDSLSFILQASQASRQNGVDSNANTTNSTEGRGLDSEAEASLPRKKSKSEMDNDVDLDLEGELDGIPSLSLPPPIIPFRTYGHNYLDKRALITVSLTNSSVKLYKLQDPNRPEQFATSSLKLVMTSRPDATLSAIPHTIILPLAEDRDVFSIQVESLDNFTIEWELMPTFGSKVIGKAVALPSLFEAIADRKKFVLPLQDVYLKVVGEVTFELDCVKPFDGVQLEIGGRIETYWKSTLPAVATAPNSQQRMTPTSGVHPTLDGTNSTDPSSLVDKSQSNSTALASASTSSSATVGPSTSAANAALNAGLFVTASSLSGQHLRVAVQVTKDGVAVVYSYFTLPIPGLDLYVGGVTGEQFCSMAKASQRDITISPQEAQSMGLADWKSLIGRSMITLEALLKILPVSIGIDLDVLYPSTADVRGNPSLPKIEVNAFVDAILHTVYRSGTSSSSSSSSRKILFSSRSPTVCTALNWKQPNYAVLFASYCGLAHDRDDAAAVNGADGIVRFAPCDRGEPDARRSSVSEAVRFAKSNNLLGVMVDAVLLNHVPQLVHAIRSAGLLLITIGKYAPVVKVSSVPIASDAPVKQAGADVEMPDGSVEDGIVSAR